MFAINNIEDCANYFCEALIWPYMALLPIIRQIDNNIPGSRKKENGKKVKKEEK